MKTLSTYKDSRGVFNPNNIVSLLPKLIQDKNPHESIVGTQPEMK